MKTFYLIALTACLNAAAYAQTADAERSASHGNVGSDTFYVDLITVGGLVCVAGLVGLYLVNRPRRRTKR